MACLIKGGNKDLIPDLWEAVKNFVFMYCNRFYNSNTELCRSVDVELEDLTQESYFALLRAVESYEPEKEYKLLTYMTYHLKNMFNELTGLRAKKYEALNRAMSLYTPMNDNDTELIDTVADTAEDIEEAERRIYNKHLHDDLEKALNRLKPMQESVIKKIYYNGLTVKETGKALCISETKARTEKEAGLRELRRNRVLKEYREDIISRYGYRSNFIIWKHSGYSSTERTAFKLLGEL